MLPAIKVDPDKNLKQWIYFDKFNGFQNRDDATMLRGSFVVGENVTMVGSSLPTTRQGYEPVGTEASDSTPCRRAWVYETREGVIFILKVFSTKIQYWWQGESTQWLDLKTGLTNGLEMGFANIGDTAALTSQCNFSNGTDGFFQFSGANGKVASATAATIVLQGAITLANLGFTATGSVSVNGVEYAYTGLSSQTFTGVTPDPLAAGVVLNQLTVQTPAVVSGLSSVQGSVMAALDGRLHMRQETRKSVSQYSQLDDPDDFTTGSVDGDGGAKEIAYSGAVNAYAALNEGLLILKDGIISFLRFIQSGARLDVPFYTTLTTADDRSTSLGSIGQKSTFATPYGPAFVTPDKRLVVLTGITANNVPQYLVLSDSVQPIFDAGDHTSAVGIVQDFVLRYSFKSSSEATYNDVEMVGDMTKQTLDVQGRPIPIQWDAPATGRAIADYAIVLNSDNKKEVWWFSALNSNAYRIISDKTDNSNPFTSTIRTWAEHFDKPANQKLVDMYFLEVKMKPNTQLLQSVLYDENGSAGREEFTRVASMNEAVAASADSYNAFGSSVFGSQKFGSNPEIDQAPVYRFEQELRKNTPFWNISLQLSAANDGADFQLVRFGWRLVQILEPERKYLMGASDEI